MIKRCIIGVSATIAALILLQAKLAALEPVVLHDSRGEYPVGLHLEILEDAGKRWTIHDVTSERLSKRFIKSETESPSYGFTASAYWVRFNVKSASRRGGDWLLELDFPLMDHISLFVPQKDGAYLEKKYGYSLPFSRRDIRHRNFVFALPVSNDKTDTFYLRFESADRIEFPLTIWSGRAFQEKDHVEQLIFGAYYGILLVMALYNFFLFLSIRDRSYLYYVLYILSFSLYQMTQNGLAYELFYPDSWNNHYVHITQIIMLPLIIKFVQSFLSTQSNTPRFHKILTVFIFTFIISFCFSFFLDYKIVLIVNSILVIITAVTVIVNGVIVLRKRYRPAIFFMVAWSLFIIGGIIYTFKAFGVLPNNYFTSYSIQVGSALEVILLSLGLGDRIKMMRDENERIQNDALTTTTRMADSFSRFVPKEFLTYLNRANIVDVRLGDQVMKEMTVLFSDIRSFTNISEHMTPQENIDFLNSYLMSIGPIIRKNNGFIDKYIGDAIMALFPESVDDAVSAAIDMQKQVGEFNELRKLSEGEPIQIGVGIHTGKLMLGTIGEYSRFETTVIADAVNVASRLEGLNKKLRTDIIISRDVFDKLKEKDRFPVRKIGRIRIKGKDDPVSILEVLVDRGPTTEA